MAGVRFFKDFRIIDIPMGTGLAIHPLYIKEHSGKAESNGRTLFVGNIDYLRNMTNERMNAFLSKIFEQFGGIEIISMSNFHSETLQKSRFALVTFDKKSSMKSALNASEDIYYDIGQSVAEEFGIGEYLKVKRVFDISEAQQPEVVDVEELKSCVYQFLQKVDEVQDLEKIEQKRKANIVDDDGFQVVSRIQKKKRVDQKRGTGGSRLRPKKESKELKNFYRHQIREEKRNQLIDLREKFEEDKKKVAALKAARKFKPF